jgi:hypothetical protein
MLTIITQLSTLNIKKAAHIYNVKILRRFVKRNGFFKSASTSFNKRKIH